MGVCSTIGRAAAGSSRRLAARCGWGADKPEHRRTGAEIHEFQFERIDRRRTGPASLSRERLRLVVGGYGVTGDFFTDVRATNTSGGRGALRGRPGLVLHQGGQEILLAIKPLHDVRPTTTPDRFTLEPGMSATVRLE